MACQSPPGVLANFKKRAKCCPESVRGWPSEIFLGNSLKELRAGGLSPADAGWSGAGVASRSQVMPVRLGPKDMLPPRALAAGHFELNDWQVIPVSQHLPQVFRDRAEIPSDLSRIPASLTFCMIDIFRAPVQRYRPSICHGRIF